MAKHPPTPPPPLDADAAADDDLRGAAIFQGLLKGLGARFNETELPRALEPRCGLHLDDVYRFKVLPALTELAAARDIHETQPEEQPARVLTGLRMLGRALRGFAATGHRCHLPTISGRLSRHANRLLFDMNASDVGTNPSGQWELKIEGNAVGSALHRATRAMLRDERYMQAGFTLAMALVYAAGGEEGGGDEPLGPREVWRTIDTDGRVLGEDALEEHFRELRRTRLHQLASDEQRLAALPSPSLMLRSSQPMCCCCWATGADEGEGTAHTVHIF